MTRIAVALGLLILAILAAVAYVLARPRWRWEQPRTLAWFAYCGCGVLTGGAVIHKPNCPFGATFTTTSRNSPSVSRDSTAGWAEAGFG